MLKVETVFTNKVIILGLKEEELPGFLEFMIEYAWVHTKVPAAFRNVKESEYAVLEKLPKTFNIKETVQRAIKRSALIMENVGPIYVGLNVRVNNMRTGVNPGIKVEIDKFIFERDDRIRSLIKFVTEMIKEWDVRGKPKPVAGALKKATPVDEKAMAARMEALRRKMLRQEAGVDEASEETPAVEEKVAAVAKPKAKAKKKAKTTKAKAKTKKTV
jgi:hypothetical protein